MANRAILSCVNEALQKVMLNELPFSGKVVVLLGDFRQMCPVVTNSSKSDVIDASIKSSSLWPLFKTIKLITPICNASDPDFAQKIDEIGNDLSKTVNVSFLLHSLYPSTYQCASSQLQQINPQSLTLLIPNILFNQLFQRML
jgi:hypothetical protein